MLRAFGDSESERDAESEFEEGDDIMTIEELVNESYKSTKRKCKRPRKEQPKKKHCSFSLLSGDEETREFDDKETDESNQSKYTRLSNEKILKLPKTFPYLLENGIREVYLPTEILCNIFLSCSQLQLMENRMVSKQWKEVAEQPHFWAKLSEIDFPHAKKNFIKMSRWSIPKFGATIRHIRLSKSAPSSIRNLLEKHCISLDYINLKGIQVAPSFILTLAENNPNLGFLNVSGGYQLNGELIRHVVEKCPQLTHFIGHHCLFHSSVLVSFHMAQNLRVLCLNNNLDVFSSLYLPDMNLCSLEFLEISSTNIDDVGISKLLMNSKQLKTLLIQSCSKVSGSFLAQYSNFPRLLAFDASRTLLDDTGLFYLSKCIHLRKLDISYCKNLTSDGIHHFVNEVLEKEGLLEEFWFKGSNIDGDTFSLLDQFSHLKRPLDTSSCRNIPRHIRVLPRSGIIPSRTRFLHPLPKYRRAI